MICSFRGRVNRHLIVLKILSLSVGASFVVSSTAQPTYYDKYIYIKSLTSPPISPKNLGDCHRYDAGLDKFLADVTATHEQCLKVESKPTQARTIGSIVDDAAHKCSNPTCQDLHSAMYKIPSEISKKKDECRVRLRSNPEWKKECKRLAEYDKPIERDPLGDAVLSAGTSAARGAVNAGAKKIGKKILEESAKEELGLNSKRPTRDGCD